mmetsp:Transcript_27696/g.31648  ORF Transcript_27696/g.31648 Transcript_27696/m.31648 type:complete len:376 (-) Transcript_27696:63-1190(-)
MMRSNLCTFQIFTLAFIIPMVQSFSPSISSRRIIDVAKRKGATQRYRHNKLLISASKGFGSPTTKVKSKVKNEKTILKQLKKTYGGTSPQDIARGTQKLIDEQTKDLPPHIQMALQIYPQLKRWNQKLEGLNILQQANLPEQEIEGNKRCEEELNQLMKTHGFDEADLQKIFQKLTWDASADAKAARSITGEMPTDIQRRVQAGCRLVAKAAGKDGTCLDVGCGYGVLVPYLIKAGVPLKKIYGIDLSAEMIRNAQTLHPGANFETADFLMYSSKRKYDAIIFCSSLHDLPDPILALQKARDLLSPAGGKIIVLHPQGASHVQKQAQANPILVQRGLPTSSELKELEGLDLVIEPAASKSLDESKDGYLAVLKSK